MTYWEEIDENTYILYLLEEPQPLGWIKREKDEEHWNINSVLYEIDKVIYIYDDITVEDIKNYLLREIKKTIREYIAYNNDLLRELDNM